MKRNKEEQEQYDDNGEEDTGLGATALMYGLLLMGMFMSLVVIKILIAVISWGVR